MKKIFTNLEEIISSTAFVVMLLSVSVNVIGRFIFSRSFAWTEEIAYMAFTYAVFFGACTVYKRRGMIAIDVLVDRLPKTAQRVIQAITFALLTVGNVVMVYYSFLLTQGAWVRPTANLRIPYSFIDVSALIAFVLLTFYSARFFYWTITGREIEEASLEERA